MSYTILTNGSPLLPTLKDKMDESEVRKAILDLANKFNISLQETQTALNALGGLNTYEIFYVPALVGFGTPTGVEAYWQRVGSKMRIRGRFTSGTPTPVEARIPLPSIGVVIDSTITTLGMAGSAARSPYADPAGYPILMEPRVAYLTMGGAVSGVNGFAKQNGNNLVNASDSIGFFAEVPIAGWGIG